MQQQQQSLKKETKNSSCSSLFSPYFSSPSLFHLIDANCLAFKFIHLVKTHSPMHVRAANFGDTVQPLLGIKKLHVYLPIVGPPFLPACAQACIQNFRWLELVFAAAAAAGSKGVIIEPINSWQKI